jgi:Thrombospondin type 3 repeat
MTKIFHRIFAIGAMALLSACGAEPVGPGPELESTLQPVLMLTSQAPLSSGLVIDDFTSGGGTWSACGNATFNYQEDTSIAGGARELVVRDAWSCRWGLPTNITIDEGEGTAEFWASHFRSPAIQILGYGTAIGIWSTATRRDLIGGSWGPNRDAGTELDLELTMDDQIRIDVQQINDPNAWIRVLLIDGMGGSHEQFFQPIAAGTNLFPLSGFPSMTEARAADIDGISVVGGVASPRGSGLILASLGIELAVSDSDGDGINDDVDNCPAVPNANQADLDGDGQGDVCDADIDGDGFDNDVDAFPTDPTEWADTDGDGFGDNSDPFPNSDTSATIVVAGNDSGVSNQSFGDGSFMADYVGACGVDVRNHGQFVSCVSALAEGWKKDGLLSGKEKGNLVSAAAQSDVGKSNNGKKGRE